MQFRAHKGVDPHGAPCYTLATSNHWERIVEIISKGQAFAKGLRTFFTGKPCPHGHTAERLVFNSKCVECARIERERSKQRLSNAPRVVLGRISVPQPEPAPVAPRVVEAPPPPPPLPDLSFPLPVDPSIQHLFDRGLNHMPFRARPGCEIAHAEKPKPTKRVKKTDPTGGSKRVRANTDTVEPVRTRKPKREEMYGPFRPRGNPNWYKKLAQAPETKPVPVAPPPSIVAQATAPKPKTKPVELTGEGKKEARRIQQRLGAQERARAKMDRLMQFASGQW